MSLDSLKERVQADTSVLDGDDQPLFTPDPAAVAGSQLTAFIRFVERREGLVLPDQAALQRWAILDGPRFWTALLAWLAPPTSGMADPALLGDRCETARFFPDLRLNYAEALLAGDDGAEAVIARRADGEEVRLTRGELRRKVRCLASGFQTLGLAPGDAVAAVLRNDVEAVVAVLAAAACGATIATVGPEMGPDILAERLETLEPRLLIVSAEPRPQDGGAPVVDRVSELITKLPSLKAVVALDGAVIDGGALPVLRAADLAEGPEAAFDRFPFNHPLFVLFSSGTTGKAKGFVHGAGGTLLEHLKEHRLHGDLRPGERLFFQTSPAWMMWHWQLSALASGAAIVLYDGPVDAPETLWRLADETGATCFGTSPPYLGLCRSLDYRPGDHLALKALRSVLSTGSVLSPQLARWVREAVKPLPVQSISGGSDIIGCFVLGSPNLPTFAGEAQCVSLGLDVRPSGPGGEGELTCHNPFPSRPLSLLADPFGVRFHEAYFSRHVTAWSHGDWIRATPRGGVILRGRMDGVLNIRGVRVGPAEVYAVLADEPRIAQALAVEQSDETSGEARMALLVVPVAGVTVDDALRADIRRLLTRRASAVHAPAVILAVDALPTTHSGKLSEAAAADAVNGRSPHNLATLRNPESVTAIRQAMAAWTRDAGGAAGGSAEDWLGAVWRTLLGAETIGLDDNFFDLGGHSLTAARVLAEVRRRTGRRLPMATLLHAPTIRTLAAVIDAPDWSASSRIAPLRTDGTGEPLFIVHSMTGNVLQLHSLVRALDCGRPIHGVQARGIDLDEAPLADVEAMATDYVAAIRTVQPKGPYRLAGFSFGGLAAFEMARRLEAMGEPVAELILLDSKVDKRFLPAAERARLLMRRLAHHARRIRRMPLAEILVYLRDRAFALAGRRAPPAPPLHEIPPRLQAVRDGIVAATGRYRPGAYGGEVLFVRAEIPEDIPFDAASAFRAAARGGVTEMVAPGDHDGMIEPPHAATLAAMLSERLRP
ncbi:acetoacetate--CoA ligase [Caulobacter mirabilis]|uniref:Acetoacetate--CoA ligase n=1 Tax=Caulobacter mirabilis TaxID=69666 RepID=A0A2D2AZ63_9CAUL|nr:acetoacetate--CoA ligase [Caulobacter mirabilis]ATQ43282.1 acetoacetate--CoA ligase [Caulobacter mirabilis]